MHFLYADKNALWIRPSVSSRLPSWPPLNRLGPSLERSFPMTLGPRVLVLFQNAPPRLVINATFFAPGLRVRFLSSLSYFLPTSFTTDSIADAKHHRLSFRCFTLYKVKVFLICFFPYSQKCRIRKYCKLVMFFHLPFCMFVLLSHTTDLTKFGELVY